MRNRTDLRLARTAVSIHESKPMTFGELVAAYCAVVFDGADLRMKKWVIAFGADDAWSLTADDLLPCRDRMREDGYKSSSINRDIAQIGSIYRWGRKLAPRGHVSPTRGIEKLAEDLRIVEITQVEVDKLLAGAHGFRDRRFVVYVRLLVEAGCRKGEVLTRRWRDVDLEKRRIIVDAASCKTRRARILHFSPETAALICRVWPNRHPDALLFEGRLPGQPIDYRRQWESLTAGINRPDLHQHDLRHVAAVRLLQAGVSKEIASQALGNSCDVLIRRYAHLAADALQNAVEQSWSVAL